jgi:hypothetical protein
VGRRERLRLEVVVMLVETGREGEDLGRADVMGRGTGSFRHFKRTKQGGKRGKRGRENGEDLGSEGKGG